MSKVQANLIHLAVLTVLIIFTVALGINNYNSGIYADTHGISGSEVGWFVPNGTIIFAAFFIASICYVSYVAKRFFGGHKPSH